MDGQKRELTANAANELGGAGHRDLRLRLGFEALEADHARGDAIERPRLRAGLIDVADPHRRIAVEHEELAVENVQEQPLAARDGEAGQRACLETPVNPDQCASADSAFEVELAHADLLRRPFCAAASSSRACSIATGVSFPDKRRASSRIRSSPSTAATLLWVRPLTTCFSTVRCLAAKTAICGRCVMQMTCRLRATAARARPTASAVAPPMPASTSSKRYASTGSLSARTRVTARRTRDSSPPEAIRASGHSS